MQWTKRLLWTLAALAIVFVARPAAAYTVDWSNHTSWQWIGKDPSAPNQSLEYTPQCMDGTPTGIGVYVPPGFTNKVMYWFDGGGFCWDDQTCNTNTLGPTEAAEIFAGNLPLGHAVAPGHKHFDFSSFGQLTDVVQPDVNGMSQSKPPLKQGVFDHTAGTINPFVNYMQVFIPYCTGDLHVGFRNDTTSSGFRHPSDINFHGLLNSIDAIAASDSAIRTHLGGQTPPLVVVGGGSAGGFGALLLYSVIRVILPAAERIITISDDGVPYYTGAVSGNSWVTSLQGYFGLPTPRNNCNTYGSPPAYPNTSLCAPASTPTFQEAFMYEAWGNSWTQYVTRSYPSVVPNTPSGSPGPLMSFAAVVANEARFPKGTDAVHIIAGNDTWLYPWGLSMYPDATGQTQTVANGQQQLINFIGLGSTLSQVTSTDGIGTPAGALPWNRHHCYLYTDTSTWDTSTHGSGVKQFFQNITPSGGW
jgi:hypothetical protein